MLLNNQIVATGEQIKKLAQDYPKNTPVVMVNILKFKTKTDKGDESGQAAYMRYSQNVAPLLAKAGGQVLWSGQVNTTIIGDTEDQPDMILVVEYPSIQNFLAMVTSPEYQAVKEDREIALEYGGLLASSSLIKS
ncbi:MAG TPA: DUF1330 domain-containing protein [Microscillaceae bacterium]|nr:DUF1330 domain-containing protein [Microscillaceae bacterium]